MKKFGLPIVLLVAVASLLLVLRQKRSPDVTAEPDAESESADPLNRAGTPRSPRANTTSREASPVKLSREVLAQTPDPSEAYPSLEARARDRYYDRLMLKQGRDSAKEYQLLSKLVETFSERGDASVGEVACSAEFCRVGLVGVGQVNVRKQWQDAVFAAVEPRGFRFFIVSRDDANNTMATCYFGRDDSWTVPDFAALGLAQATDRR